MLQSLTDIETIRYRQHAYRDCCDNAQIVREMYQIAIDAIEGERKELLELLRPFPSGVLHRAVEVLQMFVGMLKRLRAWPITMPNSFTQKPSHAFIHVKSGTQRRLFRRDREAFGQA